MIERLLSLNLPARQSAFLWGPRKTGKSTFLKNRFPDSVRFDLLQSDLFLDLTRTPSLLRERLLALPPARLKHPVIIDEVQKVPALLDEVHWLIENKGLRFILCGSSARKLKRSHVNLLGGRAWRFFMHPLVSAELKQIDLLKILNQGMIPTHYLQKPSEAAQSLKAYVHDYLREEVFAEGLVRNVPAFSRFFDAIGYSHAEMVNYTNIARDCGVDSKTVKEYFQILEDTLLATLVPPYKRKQNRQVISKSPKFYLFDTGTAGTLTRRRLTETKGPEFGKAFEHFIFNEIKAWSDYSGLSFPVHYWRTKTGLEVDFILDDGSVAVEAKGAGRLQSSDLNGLKAFKEDNTVKKAIVVGTEKQRRVIGDILVLPWQEFLNDLWSGKILS